MASSVKLDLGSGHDLTVHEFELLAQSLLGILPRPLFAPALLALSLKIHKLKKKNQTKTQLQTSYT